MLRLRKEATQPTLLTAFKQIVGKKTAHTVYRLIHRRPIIGNLNVGQRKAVARQGLHNQKTSSLDGACGIRDFVTPISRITLHFIRATCCADCHPSSLSLLSMP
jgi:hypothetical protein